MFLTLSTLKARNKLAQVTKVLNYIQDNNIVLWRLLSEITGARISPVLAL